MSLLFPYGINDWFDWSLVIIAALPTMIIIISIIEETISWTKK